MNYFTADWHFGEDRLGIDGKPNVFYRPFRSVEEQNQFIYQQFIESSFRNGDSLYHLGDVFFHTGESEIQLVQKLRDRYPDSIFCLIRGNYDEGTARQRILKDFFDEILSEKHMELSFGAVYMNHYPIQCLAKMGEADWGLTGHIHGLWKVQKRLINVGVDAWHFRPVSEDELAFCAHAMLHFYDENVFPYDSSKS